jgi:hypothetical protein
MLAAGWNAHTLIAPGKFLIAAAEHDTPKRARASRSASSAGSPKSTWPTSSHPSKITLHKWTAGS